MGLLDDLLAGLANQGAAGASAGPQIGQTRAQQGGAGGVNTALIMKALLPLVLAMLMNRNRGAQQRDPQAGFNQGGGASGGGGLGDLLGSGGGGLGDLLGSLLGGSGGGGLGDLLSKMQRSGFGEQANSWVGRGQNQPLPPSAMEDVFGRSGLAQLARSAGLSEEDTSRGLSQLLPEVVDHVTPDGEVPNEDALAASIEGLARRYGLA
jgi:uncharacterized protein YidB (DUF937 family)